jgi:serine/threonine protein kinase
MQNQGGAYKKIDNFFFDPTKLLGKGAFGSVYKAHDESKNNLEVACKMIPAAKLLESDEQYNLFMREVEVLRQIKGNHIVQLIDVKRTPNNLYIFIDYCDGGDLEKQIKSKKEFTEEEACTIIKQIADAFVTLDEIKIFNSKGHQVTIMHRDIKPANILFHQGKVKIADFGFAKLVDEVDKNVKKAHTLLGTPLYMAPQILNDENYSAKCDVWSTGVLFYQLIFGKLPWNGFSVPNLYENIKSKSLEFPKTITKETKDLLQKMLKVKDEDRISWKEVYDHPALKNIKLNDDKKIDEKKTDEKKTTNQQKNQNTYDQNFQQQNYQNFQQNLQQNQNFQNNNQQQFYGNNQFQYNNQNQWNFNYNNNQNLAPKKN